MIFIGAPSPRSQARDNNVKTTSNPLVNVLEISCATTANLPHYPDNIRVVYTSDNPYTDRYLRACNDEVTSSNVELKYLLSPPDDLKGLSDNAVDVVVASYALSSTQDVQATLQEILRVLKPVSYHRNRVAV